MSPSDSPDELTSGNGRAAAADVLTVRDLHKRFGAVEVLKGIDLDIRRGQVVALIGPSGSGKTTVLRCLNGLEVPDSGTVQFAEGAAVDFGSKPPRRTVSGLREHSAMVFQHYNLFPHRTVLENVMEGPVRVQRRSREEASADSLALLERVGLADKRDAYPYELSGGQQQRVGIVRALALKPRLLLFDEPTSALDPELVGEVLEAIRELAAEGWTMLLVTHELRFARDVADRVIFMDGGVVVEEGPPSEVLTSPKQERTRQFVQRLLDH
jgi:cystine transport system ATP-binding protein